MSVKAVFLYPENGYRHNQEKGRECGLEVGAKYEVSGINMGQSSTSVYLEGFKGSFNSVHFEFEENGKPLDIFQDPRFNPYLSTRGGPTHECRPD